MEDSYYLPKRLGAVSEYKMLWWEWQMLSVRDAVLALELFKPN